MVWALGAGAVTDTDAGGIDEGLNYNSDGEGRDMITHLLLTSAMIDDYKYNNDDYDEN